IRLKLLRYFEQRVGEVMSAVVTGVEAFGVFVQCQPIPGEGLIPRDRLTDDTYEYDRAKLMLVGLRRRRMFRLGDLLEVQVARVDLSRRELDFEYIKHLRSPHVVSPEKSGRGKRPARKSTSGERRKKKKR
ncbi:MAG TPA: S1 RNA-binding domain-containing protein, partial [Pirellulaceae bacterium]